MCQGRGASSAKPVDNFGLQQQAETQGKDVCKQSATSCQVMWYGKGTSAELQVSVFMILCVAVALRTSRVCSI